jgi:hypothetical protein
MALSHCSMWHGSLSLMRCGTALSLRHMAHPPLAAAHPPPPTASHRIARLSLSAQHMARLPLIAAHGTPRRSPQRTTPPPPPSLAVLPGSRSRRSIWHGSLSLQHMAGLLLAATHGMALAHSIKLQSAGEPFWTPASRHARQRPTAVHRNGLPCTWLAHLIDVAWCISQTRTIASNLASPFIRTFLPTAEQTRVWGGLVNPSEGCTCHIRGWM